MPTYTLEAQYLLQNDLRGLDDALVDELWALFQWVGRHWAPDVGTERMRSNFLVFISNRIETDYRYLADYRNAAEVIEELRREIGAENAYLKLGTDPHGTVQPPLTRLARARQLVVHEFIHLFLALGGFKSFDANGNFQSYIGGGNLPTRVPYRAYTPPKE